MGSRTNPASQRSPRGGQLPFASRAEEWSRHAADGLRACDRAVSVTPRGLARMKDVIAMVKETGRYPSSTALDASERSLAAWLRRRRREAEAGTLAPAFQVGLDVLPDWHSTPKFKADDQRWAERLTALSKLRAAGHDWPRHKGADTPDEHQLGVWIHTQRFKLRRGELDALRSEALDSAVPGWRTGRRRGPRPFQQ